MEEQVDQLFSPSPLSKKIGLVFSYAFVYFGVFLKNGVHPKLWLVYYYRWIIQDHNWGYPYDLKTAIFYCEGSRLMI